MLRVRALDTKAHICPKGYTKIPEFNLTLCIKNVIIMYN